MCSVCLGIGKHTESTWRSTARGTFGLTAVISMPIYNPALDIPFQSLILTPSEKQTMGWKQQRHEREGENEEEHKNTMSKVPILPGTGV